METRPGPEERHLDPLALDAMRAGEGPPEDAAHVASCPHCRAALAKFVVLQDALTNAQPRIPEVPRNIELRIVEGYRDRFKPTVQPAIPALVGRWAFPAIGAVAAAALLFTINPIRLGDPGGVPHSPAPVASALDEMGELPPGRSVDIVDAFRLARALRDGRQIGSGWDADGNGLVDAADVRILTRRIVAL